MIIKKININNYYEYDISIPTITIDYLKEIQRFFDSTGIIKELYEKTYMINNLLTKIQNKEIVLKLINQITIYNEGLNSSKIENIFKVISNDNKILSYINQVWNIEKNNGLINQNILINFHDNIEKQKLKGIRKDLNQFIGNYKAPNGKHIKTAMENFWNIYLGNNNFNQIDQFIRWAYQHLLFENIHPFDDGNGRSGRMLNFFFFKNQANPLFNDFLFETSSNIFKTKEVYNHCLANTKVNIKTNPYPSDIKKSISKDITFCKFMLDKMLEKLNWVINNIKTIEQNILKTYHFLNTNNITKKYTNILLEFFALTPIFNKALLIEKTGIDEETVNQIIKTLEANNLIKNNIFLPFYYIEKVAKNIRM